MTHGRRTLALEAQRGVPATAWILHHLMQHEAEHRSQIGRVRETLGAGVKW